MAAVPQSGPPPRGRPADAEGTVPFGDWQTWYRVTGDLGEDAVPLVVVHETPGEHDGLVSLSELAAPERGGRPVVHYDRLGHGRSTRLPGRSPDFWTDELDRAELENLLAYLGVDDGYHLLGHGTGGMVAADHAAHSPSGLKRLIIANAPAASTLYSHAGIPDDDGNPFCERDVVDRLEDITVPTLVLAGRRDWVPQRAVRPYVDLIRRINWQMFESSGHSPHAEETDEYLDVVADFLSGAGDRLRLV